MKNSFIFYQGLKTSGQFPILILPNHLAAFNPVSYFLFYTYFSLGFPDTMLPWLTFYLTGHSSVSFVGSFLSAESLNVGILWTPSLAFRLFPIGTFSQSHLVQFCHYECYLYIANSKICTCNADLPTKIKTQISSYLLSISNLPNPKESSLSTPQISHVHVPK